MAQEPTLSYEGPFRIADLRAEKWARVPADPGVYRWYFPKTCLESLGIASRCDLSRLSLLETDDGMVAFYFGIATSLSQRIAWHAAQPLNLSALRSGFLSTYRFSLLALTDTDYSTGENAINQFMDGLKIEWAVTRSKDEAETIERLELAGEHHYPINIQHNNKEEVAGFVRYVKERRRAYKARFLLGSERQQKVRKSRETSQTHPEPTIIETHRPRGKPMTNAEKILALLSRNPGLDDDEISSHANIRPRQQVNQICRLLESRGQIQRVRGPRGKVVNYLTGKVRDDAHEPPVTTSPIQVAADSSARHHHPRWTRRPRVESSELDELSSLDLTNTLVLIPCSGSKAHGSGPVQGPSIMDSLPKTLGEELTSARAKVAEKSRLDDSALMPAWLRYKGTLYHSAQPALQTAVNQGQKLAILSGGYGLVLATEPIGYYERVFKYSDWPRGLLERVLLHYVRANEIQNVVAFVSATTGYRDLLNRVEWRDAGLKTVALVMPEATTGAMVKAPRAQGEALSALLNGNLSPSFVSSDGLKMEVQSISIR